VLLITSDQQRKDSLSTYNPAGGVISPHLDALATDGVVFDRAYTPHATCTPERCHSRIPGPGGPEAWPRRSVPTNRSPADPATSNATVAHRSPASRQSLSVARPQKSRNHRTS
jgi:hypothetical protein